VTIVLNDNTVAFWYVEIPNGNWTAALSRRPDCVVLKYRFRFYRDNNAFDSQDVKHGYRVPFPPIQTNAEVIDLVRGMIAHMKTQGASDSWELLRGTSTTKQFMDQFMTLPFVNQRAATPKEAEALKSQSADELKQA
jgi:hypothetical protein